MHVTIHIIIYVHVPSNDLEEWSTLCVVKKDNEDCKLKRVWAIICYYQPVVCTYIYMHEDIQFYIHIGSNLIRMQTVLQMNKSNLFRQFACHISKIVPGNASIKSAFFPSAHHFSQFRIPSAIITKRNDFCTLWAVFFTTATPGTGPPSSFIFDLHPPVFCVHSPPAGIKLSRKTDSHTDVFRNRLMCRVLCVVKSANFDELCSNSECVLGGHFEAHVEDDEVVLKTIDKYAPQLFPAVTSDTSYNTSFLSSSHEASWWYSCPIYRPFLRSVDVQGV